MRIPLEAVSSNPIAPTTPAEAPTAGESTYHIFTEPTFTSWRVHSCGSHGGNETHRGWFSGFEPHLPSTSVGFFSNARLENP